ncbi:DGQHR domain-containing protein [Fluviicola sp.]|uniref:DGQHR domain-containing protein n=1 Tax=Fluviicola sp. TaxID=1917219 RepID=UPI0031E0662F
MIMTRNNNHVLKTQRVSQNNQEFLLGVFCIEDILKFTRYTEYTILGFDENNENKPITREEVQRKLIPSKINSIVDFLIHDPNAIFPTNLVISIPNHVIISQVENENTGIVEITLDTKVFNEINKINNSSKGDIYLSIIDGQHRIKGIENAIEYFKKEITLNENLSRTSKNNTQYQQSILELRKKLNIINKIELPVTFFIDPVLEYQAMIFSTINRTQTKVPPDLVYSLFGLTKNDSPQKTVLSIVNTLNGRENSPFYKRIRLAGSGSKEAIEFYSSGNPVLSQATMVKSILELICISKREEEIARHQNRKYFLQNNTSEHPFRRYYANDNDVRIIRIIFAFFSAVRNTFTYQNQSLWDFETHDTRKPMNILQTTLGFTALLGILKETLKKIKEEDNDKIEVYESILSKAKDLDFIDNNSPKKYPYASKTKSILYNDIGEKIWGNSFEKRKIIE